MYRTGGWYDYFSLKHTETNKLRYIGFEPRCVKNGSKRAVRTFNLECEPVPGIRTYALANYDSW